MGSQSDHDVLLIGGPCSCGAWHDPVVFDVRGGACVHLRDHDVPAFVIEYGSLHTVDGVPVYLCATCERSVVPVQTATTEPPPSGS